jgi:hypothetical protein
VTVAELVAALRDLPGDWPVYVRGYEGGVDDVTELVVDCFVRDVYPAGAFGGAHNRYRYEHWDADDEDLVPNGVQLACVSR